VAILILVGSTATLAQSEQAPMIEKDVIYRNWTHKSVKTGEANNLRDLARGKKLVVVVYFAPWCPNWGFDAPKLEKFYEKYKGAGLEIIGMGEYDSLAAMKSNVETLQVTFPVFYESLDRADKQKTEHYKYRVAAGDMRGWGSPWYVFVDPQTMEKTGETLLKKTHVINGEMIMDEGERFIRERLGLPAIDLKTVSAKEKIEPCDTASTDKNAVVTKKPPLNL
jgi:thiol-disulfide isomerase/thioredoxin